MRRIGCICLVYLRMASYSVSRLSFPAASAGSTCALQRRADRRERLDAAARRLRFGAATILVTGGNLIFFLSDRDGSRCVWAQRVDPATRQPVGAPFASHHAHQVRNNLSDVGDPAQVGLSVANGQMFYASFDLQSNVWLASGRAGRNSKRTSVLRRKC